MLGISPRLPGGDLVAQAVDIWQATVEALAPEHGELELGHVQPRAVLGRVMKLETPEEAEGFGGRKCLIERRRTVCREIVQDDHNLLGLGIMGASG